MFHIIYQCPKCKAIYETQIIECNNRSYHSVCECGEKLNPINMALFKLDMTYVGMRPELCEFGE